MLTTRVAALAVAASALIAPVAGVAGPDATPPPAISGSELVRLLPPAFAGATVREVAWKPTILGSNGILSRDGRRMLIEAGTDPNYEGHNYPVLIADMQSGATQPLGLRGIEFDTAFGYWDPSDPDYVLIVGGGLLEPGKWVRGAWRVRSDGAEVTLLTKREEDVLRIGPPTKDGQWLPIAVVRWGTLTVPDQIDYYLLGLKAGGVRKPMTEEAFERLRLLREIAPDGSFRVRRDEVSMASSEFALRRATTVTFHRMSPPPARDSVDIAPILSTVQMALLQPKGLQVVGIGMPLWLPDSTGVLVTAWQGAARAVWHLTLEGEVRRLALGTEVNGVSDDSRRWLFSSGEKRYLVSLPDAAATQPPHPGAAP